LLLSQPPNVLWRERGVTEWPSGSSSRTRTGRPLTRPCCTRPHRTGRPATRSRSVDRRAHGFGELARAASCSEICEPLRVLPLAARRTRPGVWRCRSAGVRFGRSIRARRQLRSSACRSRRIELVLIGLRRVIPTAAVKAASHAKNLIRRNTAVGGE